jgi:FkbM family methyltransferase
VILTSGEAPPKKIRSGPDLEPRRKDLDAGLVKYVEAFPKADYKIVSSGQYRFYVDPVKDATKDVLRDNQPWEPHVQEQLRQLIKPGDVVLDVGANIGAHTTLMADLVGKDGVVYAFEPRWNLYRELVQNLRLNGTKNVVPLRFAIGDGSGVIELKGTDSQATPSRAELRTLDSFHFQPVNLLRIDVEGYEDHVLAGAAETVKKNQPPILIEMMGGNDYTTASEEVRRRIEHTKGLLAALGYRTRKTWRHDYLAVPIGEEPDRVKLDLGLPENRAQLLSGFSWDESDSKTTFVWSEAATSTMAISLPAPSAAPYVLGLRVRAFHAIAPATAEVKLNEVNLGTINVGPEWSGLELNVPAKAVKAGVNELQFLFKKTGQPSALLSGNTDQRNLALSFDLIWLAPKELPLPGALRDPRKSPR